MSKNIAHASDYICTIKIKQLKNTIMNNAIIFSERVRNTINSLPQEERLAVACAVSCEFILGVPSQKQLTPAQQILFAIVRSYILSDSKNIDNEQKMVS